MKSSRLELGMMSEEAVLVPIGEQDRDRKSQEVGVGILHAFIYRSFIDSLIG